MIGVVGCAVLIPAIWFGAPDFITFPLCLVVVISSIGTMCPAIPAARRQVKATMEHLGLPEKPAVTVQALQSPERFDIWLLETREYHDLMDDQKDP
jgi:hypothetical protein